MVQGGISIEDRWSGVWRALGRRVDPRLFTLGNRDLGMRPAVAIVGTRHPDEHGIAAACCWAEAAVCGGYSVISGNALGIDAAAHGAALAAGGSTVIASPLPLSGAGALTPRFPAAWPPDPKGSILALSHLPPGTEIGPQHFIERDGYLAGLAEVLVVAATGVRGGTHHAVRAAQALGIPVLVADLPAGSPFAEAHRLLASSGARLVSAPPDVCEGAEILKAAAAARVSRPVYPGEQADLFGFD